MDTADTCPLSARRGQAEVLWSLTATYVAALTAYSHLLYSLQGRTNVWLVAHELLVFVIFPLYPLISLIVKTVQAGWEWQLRGRKNANYCFALMCDLHVSRVADFSEPISFRHLWQGSFVRREESKAVRIGRGVVLAFVSCQCLGTLIRTSARLKFGPGYSDPRYLFDSFEGFLPEDFESFWICIGTIGILLKSWLSFFLDVEWKSNYEATLASDDIIVDVGGIGIRIKFYLFKTRNVVCFVVLLGSAALFHEDLPLLVFFWLFFNLISLIWVAADDAEALIDVPTVFVDRFGACLLSIIPRAGYYLQGMEQAYSLYLTTPHDSKLPHGKPKEAEWYWIKGDMPWPLVLSIAMSLLRLGYYKLLNRKASARSRALSHLCMVAIDIFTMIVLPAYILTWTHMRVKWPDDDQCLAFLAKDPFWTPSF